MPLFAKFNFRATEPYVTDAPGETYVLPGDEYPTVRNGLKFGWMGSAPAASDRSTAYGSRFGGRHQYKKGVSDFVVDLPPGTYDLRGSMGNVTGGATCELAIFDGPVATGTQLTSFLNGNNGAAGFGLDFTKVARAFATWDADVAPFQAVITSGKLIITSGRSTTFTYLNHVQIDSLIDPLTDATIKDIYNRNPLTSVYERQPSGAPIGPISYAPRANLTLTGTHAAYFQIIDHQGGKWLAHSATPLLKSIVTTTADFNIVQSDPLVGDSKITAFSLPVTEVPGKPTDDSIHGRIRAETFLREKTVLDVTGPMWRGYSGPYVAAPGAIDTVVTTTAELSAALSALADGRTVWDRIQLSAAVGTYTGSVGTKKLVYGPGGGLLIEPVAGHDPEVNTEFSDLQIHGLHCRDFRSPGHGIAYYQWRFGAPSAAGINGTGKFNKAVFSGNMRFGLLHRPGMVQENVGDSREKSLKWAPGLTGIAVGQKISNKLVTPNANYIAIAVTTGETAASGTGPAGTGQNIVDNGVTWRWIADITQVVAIYMPHGESLLVDGASFNGQPGSCILAPGVRAVEIINNDVQKCAADFFRPANAATWNSVQGVFADDHSYALVDNNTVRNELDYPGYNPGVHGDFVQHNGWFDNARVWSPFRTNFSVGKPCLNMNSVPPRIYMAASITTGTSGAEPGPLGTGTGIVDGGVVWDYFGEYTTASHLYLVMRNNAGNSACFHSDGIFRQFFLDSNGGKNCPVYMAAYNNAFGTTSSYGATLDGGEICAEFNSFGGPSVISSTSSFDRQKFRNVGTADVIAAHNIVMSATGTDGSGGVAAYDEIIGDWASTAVLPTRPGDIMTGPFAQLAAAGNKWGYPTLNDDGSDAPATFRANLRAILSPVSGTAGIFPETVIDLLLPQGSTIGSTGGTPTLAAESTLTPDAATNGNTAGAPTLSANSTLAPDGAVHTQAAGTPDLSAATMLTPTGGLHAVVAGGVTLTVRLPVIVKPATLPAGTVRAQQGDTIDALIWREAGLGPADLPAVFAANPGLADIGTVLPMGTLIRLPSTQPKTNAVALVQLWD